MQHIDMDMKTQIHTHMCLIMMTFTVFYHIQVSVKMVIVKCCLVFKCLDTRKRKQMFNIFILNILNIIFILTLYMLRIK